jgi:hypothetical protein
VCNRQQTETANSKNEWFRLRALLTLSETVVRLAGGNNRLNRQTIVDLSASQQDQRKESKMPHGWLWKTADFVKFWHFRWSDGMMDKLCIDDSMMMSVVSESIMKSE